jgi:hypothetical protein
MSEPLSPIELTTDPEYQGTSRRKGTGGFAQLPGALIVANEVAILAT